MKDYLFVYGTLKKGQAPSEIAGTVEKLKYVGDGYIHGRLYNLGVYPGAVVDRGIRNKVFGQIFELPADTDSVLPALDKYEDFDPKRENKNLFIRRRVKVHRPGRTPIKSWTYVYNGAVKASPLIESGTYTKIAA